MATAYNPTRGPPSTLVLEEEEEKVTARRWPDGSRLIFLIISSALLHNYVIICSCLR